MTAAARRTEAAAARLDTRVWVMERHERTRRLIELGGLVQKAGLVELVDDDRAALYGALLGLADMLQGDGGAALRKAFRRRGRRQFDGEGAGS